MQFYSQSGPTPVPVTCHEFVRILLAVPVPVSVPMMVLVSMLMPMSLLVAVSLLAVLHVVMLVTMPRIRRVFEDMRVDSHNDSAKYSQLGQAVQGWCKVA